MFSTKLGAVLATALAGLAAAGEAQAQSPPPCPAAGTPYHAGVNCRLISVEGFPRRYEVYVPQTAPVTGSRRPVVFMFHGSSGTGEQFLNHSGWREQADATGLVAVFPTGLRYRVLDSGRLTTKWNDFDLAGQVDLEEKPAGYPEDAAWPADDVGFVDAIVRDLDGGLPIDRSRVYASGFSNGAGFTARLAVERSRVLAAAAMSGGALAAPHEAARGVPSYLTVGTLDDRVLEQTGPPPLASLPLNPLELLALPVVQRTLDAHLQTLGLPAGDVGIERNPHSTELRWPATGGNTTLRFGVLEGVQHEYPNGANPAGFRAAPEFWDFFAAHPLPQR
jgi:poly(3-hydroxybutyrate) depolymerase